MKKYNKADRVKVAKDVLSQLRTKRFIATRGVYVGELYTKDGECLGGAESLWDGPVNLKLRGKKCEVCALGSMIVARALRKKEPCDAYEPYQNLSDLFDEDELTNIEDAFERCRADGWCWVKVDAEANLKAIMRNIIRNEGEFRPDQMPGAVPVLV